MNRHDALKLLGQLTSGGRVTRRSRELLRPAEGTDQGDWFMFVPACFNEALDIKFNCGEPNPGWTQAGCFAFKTSDVIYDSAKAHQVWSEALHSINLAIVVRSGTPAGIGEDGVRYAGSVRFAVMLPTSDRKKLVEHFEHQLTQDEFVRLLINGPDSTLASRIKGARSGEYTLAL